MIKKNKGFTLIEMLIVVAVIALIVAIATPALLTSKQKTKLAQAQALEKVMNEAVTRVRLKTKGNDGTNNIGLPEALTGNNTEEAVDWLIDNGYVQ
jgi:type IV pilus assembly protein PilA